MVKSLVSILAAFALVAPCHAVFPQRAQLERIIQRQVLANGLEVIVVENHGVPLATVELDVRNGAFTQTPATEGLAHLYEHMFFKSNTDFSSDAFVRRAGELGAIFNGTTQEERVNYYLTLPSDSLEGGMRLLASAIRAPLFRASELAREREVVLGEYDRNESSPFFRLTREMEQRLYGDQASRKNTIGNRDVIRSAIPAQLTDIQRRYYVPNNTALIVAGDVDPRRVFALAERIYGDWRRAPDPFAADPVPPIPPLTRSEGVIVEEPIGAAVILMQWQGPSVRRDPAATYAADVFSDVLNGSTSRLQRRLVDGGLFQSVGVNYYTLDHTGPITISGQTTPERLREALAAMHAEVEKLANPGYFTTAELEPVKRQRAVGTTMGLERASGFAHQLGFWWSVAGLDYYMGYADSMATQDVTDLRSYARKYIVGKPRVVGVLIAPESRRLLGLTAGELVGGGKGESGIANGNARLATPDDRAIVRKSDRGQRLARTPPSSAPSRFPIPDSPFPAVNITTRFVVDGLPIILRRNTASDVVAANLYLLGGTGEVTADNAGIEPFLLVASERGTRHFPGDLARRRIEATGSNIVIDPEENWTMFGMRSVRASFDSTWMIFADRVMSATLDSGEVELVRSQMLAGARAVRDAPDALVSYLADSAAFAGHPYELEAGGTEHSLSRISLPELRRFRDAEFVTSRMRLVVVGNVDSARIAGLVGRTLGRLPRGTYRWSPPPSAGDRPSTLTIAERTLPTNYVRGYYTGPRADSRDYQALRIASAVLSGRLFNEIRSRRNLTYAVEAPFVERAIALGGLYVTTTNPDAALSIMRKEIVGLQTGLLDAEPLAQLVQGFLTEYFLKTETNAEQGDFLARADLYRGDHRVADKFVDELREVTPEDVRRVAEKYMRNVRWAYVGNGKQLTKKGALDF
ncbi:MAG: M16 family metallopeptidase [Gemmatimonadaceae bacterium]